MQLTWITSALHRRIAATLLRVAFGLALLFAPAPSLADGAGHRICNRTDSVLQIAFIYRSGFGVLRNAWDWQGYYRLEPGICGFLFPTHDAIDTYFTVYAASGGDGVAPRVLKKEDFSSSNRNATISGQMLCNPAPARRAAMAGATIETYRDCPQNEKSHYAIFWTALGQTHREVKDEPHTLTFRGIGTPAPASPEQRSRAQAMQSAVDLLKSVADPGLDLTRKGACAISVAASGSDAQILDFRYFDVTHLDFDGTQQLKMGFPGAAKAAPDVAGANVPNRYAMPLDSGVVAALTSDELSERQTAIMRALDKISRECGG